MALGDIFGGLGMGLGSAASGALAGQNKAEAEAYRRQQQALDREYKRAYLASKKKENDPYAKLREQAGQAAGRLEDKLFDPLQQGFYASPEGQPFAEMLSKKAQKFRHIWAGRIDPSDIDTYELTSNDWMKDLATPGGGGAATGGGLAATPLSAPEQAIETARRLPFLREPGTSVASFEGMPIAQTRGLGLAPGTPTAGPPVPSGLGTATPAARAAVATTPPPETPIQKYQKLAANPPKRTARPGQTPKDADREYNAAYRRWSDEVKEARAAVTLADEAAAKQADAKVKATEAHYAATKQEQERKGRTSTIALQGAQREQIQRTLPIKEAQGKATIKKTVEETKAIPKRVGIQRQQAATAARQATTAENRYGLEERKFEDSKNRFEVLQSKKVGGEQWRSLNDRAQRLISLLNAKTQRAGGAEIPTYEGSDRQRWKKELDGILSKMEAQSKKGSSSSSETFRYKGKPTPGQGGEGSRKFMGKSYTYSEFLAEGRRRNKDETSLKRTWAGLSGG